MVTTIPDILSRIVVRKREELSEARREGVEARAEASVADRRDFRKALAERTPAVIAEIKKASPSKGLLMEAFDPARIAGGYQEGGASALSVLTDERFFQGSLGHLQAARNAVTLPVLRKDFTIDPYHVYEAAAAGADAILLIAAILSGQQIREYRELASRFRMASLVEVHDEAELQVALDAGADLIGVNNRDLRTFEVAIETSLRLAERMPANVLKVSESGIHSRADVERLAAAGFQGFLVGEHLMKSSDPAGALRGLAAPL